MGEGTINEEPYVDETSIKLAVELANSLRKRMPGEQLLLADLPPGIPSFTDKCILARAFNYDCSIDCQDLKDTEQREDWLEHWYVCFTPDTEEQCNVVIEWAKDNNLSILEFQNKIGDQGEAVIKVTLPKALGILAADFDREQLPERYYEPDV